MIMKRASVLDVIIRTEGDLYIIRSVLYFLSVSDCNSRMSSGLSSYKARSLSPTVSEPDASASSTATEPTQTMQLA